ncbi:hypothetical protein QZH41_018392 [Actinostola sp. cb2023]|nr:hypothetical protein QZH41_018392 [Actinostola sp. cb2023]
MGCNMTRDIEKGIPPHVDTHSVFEEGIISLSLGAKITMEFRHPGGQHIPVLLPRRSLLVMTGESRYQWTHGITPRKFDIINEDPQPRENEANALDHIDKCDSNSFSTGVTQYQRQTRISLTFRKIRREPCKCSFPKQCDSQNYKDHSSPDSDAYTLPTTLQDAERLESTHVHDVYEKIAEHFSDTRHSPWPKIAKFLRDLPNGSLVADIGCGNGKYLGINEDIFKTGSDRSFNLAAIAKERGHSVIVCDVLDLPYRSEAFDVCICIAVLHHLSTTERRLEGLRELVRIVRPGGLVLVYVWALEQNLEKIKKADLKEIQFSAKERGENTGTHSNTGNDSGMLTNTVPDASTVSQIGNDSVGRETLKVQVNMKREVFEQQDLFVPWKFKGGSQDKSIKKTQETDGGGDPAATGCKVFHRFYHVFKEGELSDLCSRLDNVVAKDLYYDRGNWCIVLEKKT